MTETETRPERIDDRLRQGEWWRTKEGEWVRIADMAPSHRINTARMLLRKSAGYAEAMRWAEFGIMHGAPDEVVDSWLNSDDRRTANTTAWMASTALHKALVAGLAVQSGVDDGMMAVADAGRAYVIAEPVKARIAEALAEVPTEPTDPEDYEPSYGDDYPDEDDE